MSEKSGASEEVRDLVTGGSRVAVRARGTMAAMKPRVYGIKEIKEVEGLLQQLDKEVSNVPWVVVIDGQLDDFAKGICLKAKELRLTSKFWLVGVVEKAESSTEDKMAGLNPLILNRQDADGLSFLRNLIADLVIVQPDSYGPKLSQDERVREWSSRARYILKKE